MPRNSSSSRSSRSKLDSTSRITTLSSCLTSSLCSASTRLLIRLSESTSDSPSARSNSVTWASKSAIYLLVRDAPVVALCGSGLDDVVAAADSSASPPSPSPREEVLRVLSTSGTRAPTPSQSSLSAASPKLCTRSSYPRPVSTP